MMIKRKTTAACKSLRGEKGFALPMVMVFMMLGMLIIPPLLAFMGTGLSVNDMYETRTKELFAADAGVKEAIWNMKQGYQLPDQGNTVDLTLLAENPNGMTRTVTVFCAKQDINAGTGIFVTIGGSYQIISRATSDIEETQMIFGMGLTWGIQATLQIGAVVIGFLFFNLLLKNFCAG